MKQLPCESKIKQPIKLLILDRDGVINKDLGTYVMRSEEFDFIDGVIESIAKLKQLGFKIAIATNQAGIEKGLYTHESLSAIHASMLSQIRRAGGDIDRIVYCPSYDNSHPWRKPNSGMLRELLNGFSVEAHEALFIGDSVTDMMAGADIGCQLAMVTGRGGKRQFADLQGKLKEKVFFIKSLTDMAQLLIGEKKAC